MTITATATNTIINRRAPNKPRPSSRIETPRLGRSISAPYCGCGEVVWSVKLFLAGIVTVLSVVVVEKMLEVVMELLLLVVGLVLFVVLMLRLVVGPM